MFFRVCYAGIINVNDNLDMLELWGREMDTMQVDGKSG